MKRISKQMSETIELGIVLALSGGFMDAYSYMCRDHVFANAQTSFHCMVNSTTRDTTI